MKTCEETRQIRDCRTPQDWSLLALQNIRTGKSQYLVICRCEQGQLGNYHPSISFTANFLVLMTSKT